MAGNRTELMDIKQIIALKLKGVSNRKIGAQLSISRNTINHYTKFFEEQNLSYQEISTYSELQLLSLFPCESEVDTTRYQELSPYFPYFNDELKKPGCTLNTLWKEYLEKQPSGYRLSQFKAHFNKYRKKINGSCKLDHKVGQQVYIDFTGKRLEYIDKSSGEIIKVEVYVAILPASQYTFVVAVPSQKKEDFIAATNQCLAFFGGVPQALVSDNLKSAVTKTHKYAPKINRTFKDFALHHNCVVDPTRPYSPQDKALVEGAVKLVYQRIFYPLSKHTFFSLKDINDELSKLLELYNNYQFSQRKTTRKEEFHSLERAFLQELPTQPYQNKEFRSAKVQKTGHVFISEDKHYYSVPYSYISKQTEVHYTADFVEVFYKNERIASHKRDYRSGKYSTNKDHLSSSHKAYSEWSLEFFQGKSERFGEHTKQYITELIEGKSYPEIAYKQTMGILSFHKTYGYQRVEDACLRAGFHEQRHFHIIENILKNSLDKTPIEVDEKGKVHIPQHQNLRGNFK